MKEFNIYEAVSYPVKLSWDPIDNMVEDEKEGEAEEEGDKKEGEDAAAEAGANELVIFKKNESTPLIRRVTFKRREPFTVTATYDEAAMPELPPGTDPVIGTFTVNPTPKDDVVPKIRVNIMHDLHGILKCNSAQVSAWGLYTEYTRSIHGVYTECTPSVHRVYTERTPSVHRACTAATCCRFLLLSSCLVRACGRSK